MPLTKVPKAEIKITCNCGCGFITDSIIDANEHTEITGYCVSIQGEIRKRLLQEQGVST